MPETPLRAQLEALVQSVQSLKEGWRDPRQIIMHAVGFSRYVGEHAEFGRRTSTEDTLVRLLGDLLLQRIRSADAVDWIQFADRVGTRPDDVERLEVGVSGVLAAIDSGEEFDTRDITAMRSALSRLAGTGSGPDGDCNSTDGAKKTRGRPRRVDPDAVRILNAWASGQHQTYAECARALSLFAQDQTLDWKRVKRVVNREQQKKRRQKKRASTRTPD